MSKVLYNELVRDKVPEMIREGGKECRLETLDNETFVKFLNDKLQIELDDYYQTEELEELVDLIELIYLIGEARGVSPEKLEEFRQEKIKNKGTYSKKLLLREVWG